MEYKLKRGDELVVVDISSDNPMVLTLKVTWMKVYGRESSSRTPVHM